MKLLAKFAHRQVRSLIRHLKEYDQSPKPDTVHKIRVDLKKVKVILSALHACIKGCHTRKQRRFFQKIFHLAGKIRDADVLSQLLLQFHVEGFQSSNLSSELSGKKLELQIPHFIEKARKMGNKLELCSASVSKHDFHRYVRKRKKQIKSECFPLPEMNEMHNVRKDIKQVIYLCEVDNQGTKTNVFYDKVQEVIGNLHDKLVLLDLLKKNITGTGKIEEEIKLACDSDKAELINLVDFYKKRIK